jgi:hypothetical protein
VDCIFGLAKAKQKQVATKAGNQGLEHEGLSSEDTDRSIVHVKGLFAKNYFPIWSLGQLAEMFCRFLTYRAEINFGQDVWP